MKKINNLELEKKIIVVDDGSSDNSCRIIKNNFKNGTYLLDSTASETLTIATTSEITNSSGTLTEAAGNLVDSAGVLVTTSTSITSLTTSIFTKTTTIM